jgi:hypothetical protein
MTEITAQADVTARCRQRGAVLVVQRAEEAPDSRTRDQPQSSSLKISFRNGGFSRLAEFGEGGRRGTPFRERLERGDQRCLAHSELLSSSARLI